MIDDKLMDYIFDFSVYFQATKPDPVFPTLEYIDPRLPPKEQVFGFNVGDDYVAVTENFVRDSSNGVRNMIVGGEHIVASYDKDHGSLGIWKCPSTKPVKQPVDVHGRINGTKGNLSQESEQCEKWSILVCICNILSTNQGQSRKERIVQVLSIRGNPPPDFVTS